MNTQDKQAKNSKAISTEAYKGVRDFYPADMSARNNIFNKMRHVVEGYGYEEYDASILEPSELYRAKSGEEIASEQTYNFTDRGGREVTMRPEMTPTIARMIAKRRRDLAMPQRLYSIPNLFRYERPQHGRLREHWQLNVDIFGVEFPEAEAEIINIASDMLSDMGVNKDSFEIHVNFAGQLKTFLQDFFKFDDKIANKIIKIIDRYGKISDDDFIERITKLTDVQTANTILKHVQQKDLTPFKNSATFKTCEQLKENLAERNVDVLINPYLTRGFDYYTGIVFEVFDKKPENRRSLFGGGRYDELMDIFGAPKTIAVGFGMGDVTALNVLKSRNLVPPYKPKTVIYICTLTSEFITNARELANELRKMQFNTAVNLTDKKIGDQIKYADKQAIPYVIVLGESEIEDKVFVIKELSSSDELEVAMTDLDSLLNFIKL